MTEDKKQAICRQADLRREDLTQILQDMVRLPSVTHPPGGDEGRVQNYVAELFRRMGLEVDIFEPTDVPGLTEHEGYWPPQCCRCLERPRRWKGFDPQRTLRCSARGTTRTMERRPFRRSSEKWAALWPWQRGHERRHLRYGHGSTGAEGLRN